MVENKEEEISTVTYEVSILDNSYLESLNVSFEIVDNLGKVTTIKDYPLSVFLDKVVPSSPGIVADDNISSNSWHNKDTSLYFKDSWAPSGITYYYGTDSNNLDKVGDSISLRENTSGTTYYVKACSNSNPSICSNLSSYTFKLDKNTPVLVYNTSDNIKSNNWHSNNFNLGVGVSNQKDIISGLIYKLDANSNPYVERSNVYISTNTTSTTYTALVCTGAGLCSKANYIVKLDNVTPTINFTNPGYITLGQDHNVSNDYKVSYGVSGGSISCSFTNTKGLSLGVNTVSCTATSNAGRKGSASYTYRHKYSATTNCSNGRFVSNGSCYYTYRNNEYKCGCATYNSCRTSACGVSEYRSCEDSSCGIASYRSCEDSSCGIASYRSCENSSCGVSSYNTCQNSACGKTANSCRTSACGYATCRYSYTYTCDSNSCERYICEDKNGSSHMSSTDTGGCSCAKYRQTTCTGHRTGSHSSCGYATCQNSACGYTTNTCSTAACGVSRYNSCRTSACGVESYNSCRTSSCGVESYNSCRTSACGVSEYRSCEDSSCGCSVGKTCTLNENSYRYYTCNSKGNNGSYGNLNGTTCYF